VRVDPGEENSSFPFRLYSNVMHNMAVPYDGAVSDITTIFREIVTKKSTTCLDEHVFFGPFIQALRQGDEWENDWQGFLGERVHSRFFPSTLDFTTVANVVCNLLSAISRFLVDDLKLAGLLVLVDEVETAEVRRYPYHWKRTLNFLRGLTLVANDDEILDENVSSTRFLVKTGEKTGLVYSGHYPDVRYYFTTPTFLKIALALTECRVFGMLRTWKESQPLVELGEVSQGALRELFSRVAGVYCALYKIKFPAHLEHWALYEMLYPAFYAGSIRGFMKALVELLDFVRHYPGRPLEDLQRIRSF
jgi:hypothetical protein